MRYGDTRPALPDYDIPDDITSRRAGNPRRVPTGADNIYMAAMVSALSYPYSTLPTVQSFRDSLCDYACLLYTSDAADE